jgi:hypothetical protein
VEEWDPHKVNVQRAREEAELISPRESGPPFTALRFVIAEGAELGPIALLKGADQNCEITGYLATPHQIHFCHHTTVTSSSHSIFHPFRAVLSLVKALIVLCRVS